MPQPDRKAKRFFAYYKVERPTDIEKQRAQCRSLVVGQEGLIVDDAVDVGVVVDMPGYASLYDALDKKTVDAFVTDMRVVFGPTMILGLYAMCVVNGIEMWDLAGGRVTNEQISAVADAMHHRLGANETAHDMLGPKNSLS
jgi:hypothetical protein